jgi:peptidoglycan/xylan/chitin deacetylase (PgdA/CDA1 family)
MKNRHIFSPAYILMITLLFCTSVPAADTAVVLMYHRFGEDRYPETNIRIDQFEAQLNLLREGGYSVVPLQRLLDALNKGESLPEKAVVITIDDAYRSIYEVAFPRLQEYGFPFTVFVSTDGVDKGFSAYMTWEQMREMAEHGVTFANHGAAHISMIAPLKGESDEERIRRVLEDFEKGQKRLSEELQPIPGVFAYPYGEFDGEVANRLRDMGYISFGQHSGAVGPKSDLRALPRYPVAEAFADIQDFKIKVSSLPMPVDGLDPWEPVVNQDRPEITVTLGEIGTAADRLSCFIGGQGLVPVRWIEEGKKFSVGPQKPFGPGRQRVNCTVPGGKGRFFWFSHPWFVKLPVR